MEVRKRKLEGPLEILPDPHLDSRGFFMRTFDKKIFQKMGINYDFSRRKLFGYLMMISNNYIHAQLISQLYFFKSANTGVHCNNPFNTLLMEGVDVINILRIQLERQKAGLFPSQREYSNLFGITGEVVSPPRVLAGSPHPFGRWSFHSERTVFLLAAESVEGVEAVHVAENVQGGLDVKLTCDAKKATRHKVYACIKGTDWVLSEFVLETQTLETIFRNLTQEK